MNTSRQRIAVVGAGIAGLATAYFLQRRHDVVLFEAGRYLGGHANTVDIELAGQRCAVDTGFLVYNERTYPNLLRLFDELNVASVASDMSFGVAMADGLEWAGTSLDTVFAQRRRLASPAFLRMLRNILHFNRRAEAYLAEAEASGITLGQLLKRHGYGGLFRDAYLLPMAAAIWSSAPRDILGFPAATFLRFCLNHALLQVNDRPQWRTVRGGSRSYVQAIAATLPDCRLGTPVRAVLREDDGWLLSHSGGAERFDQVVFATHAPTTLALLPEASDSQRRVLGALRYQSNTAWLHTDVSLMPRLRKVWSAWNYLSGPETDEGRPVCVSYWLNQLQQLPVSAPVMVTLNPPSPPAAARVLARFEYEHPVMDLAALAAQQALPALQGQDGLWYAGAWTGYGFHEDGLKSALRIASAFGLVPDWAQLS